MERDDVISRAAAINTVHDMRKKCDTDNIDDYEEMLTVALEELCSVQRTGRWIPDNNSVYEMRFICSECKESQVVPTIGFTKCKPLWDYCPNCGAKMESEK